MTREEAIAELFAIVEGLNHPTCETDFYVAKTVDVNLGKGLTIQQTYESLLPQYRAIQEKFTSLGGTTLGSDNRRD